MAVHCLEIKRAPVQHAKLESEILFLLGEGPILHAEILYRRIAPVAFKLPREALWCLVYFHNGRNRDTGLYYSKRALLTPEGKTFRIGESIRLLEKEGLLEKKSSWGWRVPQNALPDGPKYPPIRASLLSPFLQNPTKERWIALRFILFLATQEKTPKSYRQIQNGLGCSTEIARFLAGLVRRSHGGLFDPKRCQNRAFNWVPGNPFKAAQNTSESAPIRDRAKARNFSKKRISCTELGGQYNPQKKEIQKKNPSTTPEPAKHQEGFFKGLNEELGKVKTNEGELGTTTETHQDQTLLSSHGFASQEVLPKANSTWESLEPYRAELASREDEETVQALLDMAKRKREFKGVHPDTLSRFGVDIWLELKRRRGEIRTSPIGYFFTALRNNLATGYCRLELKRARQAEAEKRIHRESEMAAVRRLNALQAETRLKIRAHCLILDPGYLEIPFLDFERSNAVFWAGFEALRNGGELDALAVRLFEFCEQEGADESHLLRFVRANPELVAGQSQDMRRARKAA